jgi:amino acid adenylation domain-containing protein
MAEVGADNLVYIMYTSGSTGRPKGVAIAHRGVVRLVKETNYIDLQPDHIVLQFASISFDASCFEIWGSLLNGARLQLFQPGLAAVEELAEKIEAYGITTLWLNASLFRQMVEGGLRHLRGVRWLLAGGDVLPVEQTRKLVTSGLDVQMINGYGPTENSTFGCCYVIPRDTDPGDSSIPIGGPIANSRAYLTDVSLDLAPSGVLGELYLGGDGLARGYWGRPGLTAERFVPDPFATSAGGRMYRTGDLGRWMSDGNIEFCGRTDAQVKIRGFRVELGEVETALLRLEGVREAVTQMRRSPDGENRLVAYLGIEEAAQPTVSELRRQLQESLPDYMLPSAFVMLPRLPLNSNGKADRAALPSLTQPETGHTSVGHSTPTEEILVSIWSSVLGIDNLGVEDDWFEVGGHSLSAMQVISRLRSAFRIELPLRHVFEERTVARLAKRIEAQRQAEISILPPPIRPRRDCDQLPLSYSQRRLWLLDQLHPDSSFYNVPIVLRLTGPLNVDALERSLIGIMQRHEVFRTIYQKVEEEPVQVILPMEEFSLPRASIAGLPTAECEMKLTALVREEAARPIDLARGPVARFTLIDLGDREHVLIATMHHIMCDAWSLTIFVRELGTYYRAYSSNESVEISPLPIQYADYALWQQEWLQGEVLEAHFRHWEKQLGKAPESFTLPTDYTRPEIQNYRGADHAFTISPEIRARLHAFSKAEGVTLFMTLLSGFQTLLHRYTDKDDILVGVPIANRNQIETEALIGFFVNMLPLRLNFSGRPTVAELIDQARSVTLDAYSHRELPFDKLAERLKPERVLNQNPLFQISFALQNTPAPILEMCGLQIELLEVDSNSAKFDLTLAMTETAEGLIAAFEYSTDLFALSTIQRMGGHLCALLEGLSQDRKRRVSDLPILTAPERTQLLTTWNDTLREYSREGCAHQVFEAQVKQAPDAVAVVSGNQICTYGELNMRANRLAHYLREMGVGPETCVGICAERSIEMIIGFLGILKAGGIYVPLDSEYPSERLAFMIRDAQVRILLVQPHLAELFTGLEIHNLKRLDLDSDLEFIPRLSTADLNGLALPDGLAYVMYTSGSTGQPKGIAVTHRNILRLVQQSNYAALNSGEVFFQLAPISFDASTFEIWGALLNHARLVLADASMPSMKDLAEAISERRVSTLWLTSSLFQQAANDDLEMFADIQQLLTGGDVLSAPHAVKIFNSRPDILIVNLYGPTENTTFTCSYPIEKWVEAGAIPIGRPISNTQVYVLDKALEPVPVGVFGEILAGGDGLARGYFRRPAATAEKFIPNPFSAKPGERMYLTGDLGRWRSDGNLMFAGRLDNQVKIHGFRVELDAVEAAVFNCHPGVKACAVNVQEDVLGNKRLVAFVVAKGDVALSLSQLRQRVTETLPKYMTPSTYLLLPELPLTPSGKTDRAALAEIKTIYHENVSYVAPRTLTELKLVQVWEETMHYDRISVLDHFFLDLGATSIMVLRATSRIAKAFGYKISIGNIFQNPTIEELARAIDHGLPAQRKSPLIPIQPKGSRSPLYCVHPGPGSPFCFVDLAYYLGQDQPFYGFQSQGVDGQDLPLKTIEEMAALYLEAIKAVQPQGPYLLGGYSFGSLVAFEMAQQLFRQGEQVSALIIIDGDPPFFEGEEPLQLKKQIYPELPDPEPSGQAVNLIPLMVRVIERFTKRHLGFDVQIYSHLSTDKKVEYFLGRLQTDGFLQPDSGTQHVLGLLNILKSNSESCGKYRARVKEVPRIICFRSTDWNPEDGEYVIMQDRWSKRFPGKVEITHVPGDHISIMTTPHVQVLAEKVREALDSISD